MKLYMVSLGCSKNRIDTELFLGVAKKYNIDITDDIDEANIIAINTCGFIQSAKEEAIDNIIDAVALKLENKDRDIKIIAMGCLVERYLNEIKIEIPEVDYFIPIKKYESIDKVFNKITSQNYSYKMDYENRVITTTKTSAYLRIAEGCDNKCSYCAIPLIRGGFVSRPFDDIISEAKYLANIGIEEITLIAQDTTRYGTDFKDKDPRRLNDLLHQISLIEKVRWIRVLYLYPDEITSEIIQEIKTNPKVVKYFDIPIQHASNKMLKLMNRRGSKELIIEHVENIRKEIPNAILRTTLITGFPKETNNDFEEMVDLIKKLKFERLGCFIFSREESTTSYQLQPRVPKHTQEERLQKIMETQKEISLAFNKSLIGKKYVCVIEGYDFDKYAYTGRNYMYAPDDVDGQIYVYSPIELEIGSFVEVEILNGSYYDLEAKLSDINPKTIF